MLAFAAPRERDHDMITHGEMLDRTAYCEDDTSPLVTIDGGKGHRENSRRERAHRCGKFRSR